MPGGLGAILLVFYLVRYFSNKNRNGVSPPISWVTMRSRLLAIFLIAATVGFSIACLAGLQFAYRDPATAVVNTTLFLLVSTACFSFFWPWPLLIKVAESGNPRRAYYLAHLLRFSHPTGEPYGAACFCAALAIARGGTPTREELDWIQTRLAKETRALGLFGAAHALVQALEGRLAKDRGDDRAAEEFRDSARIAFGTITYLSPAACPRAIRIFANEYLALDCAARGEWGAIEAVEDRFSSPNVIALRGWLRKTLMKSELKSTRKTRAAENLPLATALASREERKSAPMSADEAFAHMSANYVALLKGERRPPRTIMNVLQGLDIFFDPRSPMCRLPPELVADEEAVAQIAEAIADSIFEALRSRGAPVFALRMHGAISARVYQKLESSVMGELNTAMATMRERTVRMIRGTNRDEWIEVSRVRALYRRVEYTLGSPAAGSVAKALLFNYGNFGVMLSESLPRRRPLAHAVFHVLRNEASRFDNRDALARENKNMVVTARAD